MMEDSVLAVLKKSGQPMKSGEIAEQAGADKKEVDKALKKLKEQGLVDSPKRCFYSAK
jgi:Mn-dependent DtxR family transcriptional regulator